MHIAAQVTFPLRIKTFRPEQKSSGKYHFNGNLVFTVKHIVEDLYQPLRPHYFLRENYRTLHRYMFEICGGIDEASPTTSLECSTEC